MGAQFSPTFQISGQLQVSRFFSSHTAKVLGKEFHSLKRHRFFHIFSPISPAQIPFNPIFPPQGFYLSQGFGQARGIPLWAPFFIPPGQTHDRPFSCVSISRGTEPHATRGFSTLPNFSALTLCLTFHTGGTVYPSLISPNRERQGASPPELLYFRALTRGGQGALPLLYRD